MWSLPLHGLFRSTNLQCDLTYIPRKPATDHSHSIHRCGLGRSHLYTSISWGNSCFFFLQGVFFPRASNMPHYLLRRVSGSVGEWRDTGEAVSENGTQWNDILHFSVQALKTWADRQCSCGFVPWRIWLYTKGITEKSWQYFVVIFWMQEYHMLN